MLTVINLYTIDKIFSEEAEFKVSPLAKVLYINCLIHHFKEKKPTVVGAVAFSIFINDIKDYAKFERLFQELHKAGLVIINETEVAFQNVWGKYIDRSKLDKATPDEFVAGFVFQKASFFKEEMLKSDMVYETVKMKYKIGEGEVTELLNMFVMEQDSMEKTYSNYSDCVKHFYNLLAKSIAKMKSEVVNKASFYMQDMLESVSLSETVQMKYKIDEKQTENLIKMFVAEKDATEKTYGGYSDCSAHFFNWIPRNVNKTQAGVIKSSNNILGVQKVETEPQYACKCDRCGSEGNSSHARIYFEKVNGKTAWFCSPCWNLQSNGN